jgi:hypothetical protein
LIVNLRNTLKYFFSFSLDLNPEIEVRKFLGYVKN